MKIKESVRQLLDCNRGYAAIMMALDCSFSSAREYVKNNKDDLTKAAVLEFLRQPLIVAMLGIEEEDLLEREPQSTNAVA